MCLEFVNACLVCVLAPKSKVGHEMGYYRRMPTIRRAMAVAILASGPKLLA